MTTWEMSAENGANKSPRKSMVTNRLKTCTSIIYIVLEKNVNENFIGNSSINIFNVVNE